MPVESAADLAVFFNTGEWAESGQWTLAAGGDPSTVAVLMSRGHEPAFLGDAAVQVQVIAALVRVSDLPAGYGKGDTLAVGSDTWDVERVDLEGDGAVARVALKAQ